MTMTMVMAVETISGLGRKVSQFRVDCLFTDGRAVLRGLELNVSKHAADLHHEVVAGGVHLGL